MREKDPAAEAQGRRGLVRRRVRAPAYGTTKKDLCAPAPLRRSRSPGLVDAGGGPGGMGAAGFGEEGAVVGDHFRVDVGAVVPEVEHGGGVADRVAADPGVLEAHAQLLVLGAPAEALVVAVDAQHVLQERRGVTAFPGSAAGRGDLDQPADRRRERIAPLVSSAEASRERRTTPPAAKRPRRATSTCRASSPPAGRQSPSVNSANSHPRSRARRTAALTAGHLPNRPPSRSRRACSAPQRRTTSAVSGPLPSSATTTKEGRSSWRAQARNARSSQPGWSYVATMTAVRT